MTHFVSSFWAVLVPSLWCSRSSCFCVNLSRWSSSHFPMHTNTSIRPPGSLMGTGTPPPSETFHSSPHLRQSVNPPRFPPGTSLVLAPFAWIGHYPGNIEFGSRLLVVALVIATGWAAFTIAGWYAALLAAFVTSTSEFALLEYPRCDVRRIGRSADRCLCAAHEDPYEVECLPPGLPRRLRRRDSRERRYRRGCLLIVMTQWDRLRVAAGASLPILGLAVYNWSTFGSPWRTGYSYWLGNFHFYSLSYVFKHPWPPGGEEGYYAESLHVFHLVAYTHSGVIGLLPNIWFYPLILLGCSAVFGPPGFTLLGIDCRCVVVA